jgi:ABC-type multidrug transport system ATPase subunit
MQNILSINGLSKNYGSVQALNNLNISVQKGDVFGILGPNGSGKTTTLGIVLGVTNCSRGSFSWFEDGNSHQLRKRIGAMLDKPNFYPHLNGFDNLKLIADIKETKTPRINERLELAGMLKNANRKFMTYSTGMRQRLALAATMLGDPEVLVLDEPTNGLDPEGIADVRELILKIANEGTTVIMASHLLDEVQKVCSHVAVIKGGKKLYEGHVQSLLAGDVGIEIGSDNLEKLGSVLSTYEGVDEFEKKTDKFNIKLKPGYKASELSAFLITNGVDITHFAHNKGSLEQEFLNLLSENRD